MITEVKALVRVYEGPRKRKTPFISGYRPLFKTANDKKTSGQILLIDREELCPGDQAEVLIRFVNLGPITAGSEFHFFENVEPLGECKVLEIL